MRTALFRPTTFSTPISSCISNGALLRRFAFLATIIVFSVADADERLDHFERKIRPILVNYCVECHGNDPEDLGGNLSLMTSALMMAGGDSGSAISTEEPIESLLLRAIRYEDGLEMPPDGKLPQAVVADLEQWIRDGAIDPRAGTGVAVDSGVAEHSRSSNLAEDHWAFQPLETARAFSPLPGADGVIDAIVDSRLTDAGLKRSRRASPETLLRRLHYDLTGLPPSEELIRDFSRDPSDIAYQRVVDRLLSSDEFGRHWGRHWLDVARYADSNGSDFNATFHHAWRYRDYVITSFDRDKPFDRFVTEQIAGDLISASTDQERSDQLVATGFLMIGPKMLSERDKAKLQMDVVDDQIDTIGRAFMGLTLGCARCHDHKFDPIPTSDYYALAGIFRSTTVLEGEIQKYVSDWIETPLPVDDQVREAVVRFEQEEKSLIKKLKDAEAELKILQAQNAKGDSAVIVDDSQAIQKGHWVKTSYTRPFIGDGYLHDDNRDKSTASVEFKAQLPVGKYRVDLAYTAAPNRSRSTKVSIQAGSFKRDLIVDQSTATSEKPWNKIDELTLNQITTVSVRISNEGSDGYVIADAVRFSRIAEPQSSPEVASDGNSDRLGESPLGNATGDAIGDSLAEIKSIKHSLAELRANKPAPIPMAMAVRDAKNIEDAFVCVRGDVNLRGSVVPRGFLNVCRAKEDSANESQSSTEAFPTHQSGRVELATWICDPDHPLTARVIVNRVWMHLIGEGLVRTVDNFGVLGERPTHPELLDHLAISFLRNGWSIKKLVREIVASETYRQSTDFHPASMDVDAENRLLWRMHRKRLPAESLRDALLVASGSLDGTPSNAPVSHFGKLVSENVADPKVVASKPSERRGVYLPVIRGDLDPLFAAFDFADPDLLVGRRERTNVPSQSLVLMNGQAIQAYVHAITKDILQRASDTDQVVELSYMKLYSRFPSEDEARWMAERLPSLETAIVNDLIGAMVASSEFRLLD